jgi:hypothetical protein
MSSLSRRPKTSVDCSYRCCHGCGGLKPLPYSPFRRRIPKNSRPNTRLHARLREQRAAEQDAFRWQNPCRSPRAWATLSIHCGIPTYLLSPGLTFDAILRSENVTSETNVSGIVKYRPTPRQIYEGQHPSGSSACLSPVATDFFLCGQRFMRQITRLLSLRKIPPGRRRLTPMSHKHSRTMAAYDHASLVLRLAKAGRSSVFSRVVLTTKCRDSAREKASLLVVEFLVCQQS